MSQRIAIPDEDWKPSETGTYVAKCPALRWRGVQYSHTEVRSARAKDASASRDEVRLVSPVTAPTSVVVVIRQVRGIPWQAAAPLGALVGVLVSQCVAYRLGVDEASSAHAKQMLAVADQFGCPDDSNISRCLGEKLGHAEAGEIEASFQRAKTERFEQAVRRMAWPCNLDLQRTPADCLGEIATQRDQLAAALKCPSDKSQAKCVAAVLSKLSDEARAAASPQVTAATPQPADMTATHVPDDSSRKVQTP